MLHLIAQATQPVIVVPAGAVDSWANLVYQIGVVLGILFAIWKAIAASGKTEAQGESLNRMANNLHQTNAALVQVAQSVPPTPPAVVTITPPPPEPEKGNP